MRIGRLNESKNDHIFNILKFILNAKEIGELLISKGADINAKDIIYLNIIILFLIKLISNK